ncbi:MAG: hypothetical protein BWY57_03459 [Betaproteobacteria bacterium ADurb.Bin341]|nr:MAG: hypothetical protein BWY57_03459 [Betaproteobacteria bacterium ADurb.Bin341]
MESRCEILRKAREGKSLTLQNVAETLGLSLPQYRDVEAYDEEIEQTLSTAQVLRLFETLNLRVEDVFGKPQQPTGSIALDSPFAVSSLVDQYLARESMGLSEFEERVGWDHLDQLTHAENMLNRPIMFFQALAKVLGLDWRTLLRAYLPQS